eukprot:6195480-Pleurochrysis_carterae.AAC.1
MHSPAIQDLPRSAMASSEREGFAARRTSAEFITCPKTQMIWGKRSWLAPSRCAFDDSTNSTSCLCTVHASAMSLLSGSMSSQRGSAAAAMASERLQSLPSAETALSLALAFSSEKASGEPHTCER